MLTENPQLYLRVLWLTHWYATGERAFALPPTHGRSRRDGTRP